MARSDWAMLESREGRQASFGLFRDARPTRPPSPRRASDQGNRRSSPLARLFLTKPLGFSDPRVLSCPDAQKPLAPRRARRMLGPPAIGPRRQPAAISALALCGLAFSALPAGAATGGSVSLVAYSTPKPAYSALAAAFAKTKAGAGITVSSSFGPSGTQATSVVNGLPADLVELLADARHDQGRQGRPGVQLVGPDPDQGHGHELNRLVHRASRQSQAHHHLGRPR